MPTAQLASVTLHYEWAGLHSGPVVVLSNSLGTDLELWAPQMLALGAHFRVLRYDTRGHGGSSVPQGAYTLDALGQDVLDLVDCLNVDRAAVCGISLGGLTALWLALHAPARITGIVAANTAARLGSVEGWEGRIASVERDGMAALVPATLGRWFTPGFLRVQADGVKEIMSRFATTSAAGYVACCGALRDADLRAEVGSISVPTLILAGTHDEVSPVSVSTFLHQRIAGSSLIELNAAHLSNIEDADAFNAAVLPFLSGLFNEVTHG